MCPTEDLVSYWLKSALIKALCAINAHLSHIEVVLDEIIFFRVWFELDLAASNLEIY